MKLIQVTTILIVLCCTQGFAEDSGSTLTFNAEQLPPAFQISYEISKSAMVLGTTEATWQSSNTNHWTYRSTTQPKGIAKLFVDEISRQTLFEASDDGLQISLYEHNQKDRNERIEFDWQKLIANSEYKGRMKAIPITTNTYDELSFHILIMTNIGKLPEQFTIPVVRKNRATIYQFSSSASGIVKTGAGEFDTILLERVKDDEDKTTHRIWVAKSHHGLPIRYEKLENGKQEYVAQITQLQWLDSNEKKLSKISNSEL